jgi:hypothetical protein
LLYQDYTHVPGKHFLIDKQPSAGSDSGTTADENKNLFPAVANKKHNACENDHSQILQWLGRVTFRTCGV